MWLSRSCGDGCWRPNIPIEGDDKGGGNIRGGDGTVVPCVSENDPRNPGKVSEGWFIPVIPFIFVFFTWACRACNVVPFPFMLTWLERLSSPTPFTLFELSRWYVQSICWRLHREQGWTKSHRTLRRAHRSQARRGGALGVSGSIWMCSDPVAARHLARCRFKISLSLTQIKNRCYLREKASLQ